MDRYSTEVQEFNSTNPEAASILLNAMGKAETSPRTNDEDEAPDNEQLLIPQSVYDSLPQPLRTLCSFYANVP